MITQHATPLPNACPATNVITKSRTARPFPRTWYKQPTHANDKHCSIVTVRISVLRPTRSTSQSAKRVDTRFTRLISTDWKTASVVAAPAARKTSGRNEEQGCDSAKLGKSG